MRGLIMSLPSSGSRMFCGLIDSHPDLQCDHTLSGDIAHAHFYDLHYSHLITPIPKILLVRDYAKGAVSELCFNRNRAKGFTVNTTHVERVVYRRQLQTELLRPFADLVVNYDDFDEEVTEWESAEVCRLLGVENRVLTTRQKKLPPMIPKNYEEACRKVAITMS